MWAKLRRLLRRVSQLHAHLNNWSLSPDNLPSDLDSFRSKVPVTRPEALQTLALFDENPKNSQQIVKFTVQTEHSPPIYLGFTEREISIYAAELAKYWAAIGIKRGDRILLYDYGTSPLVYLASFAFTPHLNRGAAERLGAVAICNDGLPELVDRAIHVVRFVKPRFAFVREEVENPFLGRLASEGVLPDLEESFECVVVSADETIFLKNSNNLPAEFGKLQLTERRLLRIDVARFFALQCPLDSRSFHFSPDLHFVETVDPTTLKPLPSGEEGAIVVTPIFILAQPVLRYMSNLIGSIEWDCCRCGSKQPRLLF